MPTIKPAQKHKYNSKTVQMHKNKTLNKQNINNIVRKSNNNNNNNNNYNNKVATSHEGKVIIIRNQQVEADRTIPNNKPDIIISNN
jgi:hypothetical protein